MRLLAVLLSVVGLTGCTAQAQFDGTFVFVANRSGNWDLFLWQRGSNPMQLTSTELDERGPSLSPDGNRVAYTTSDGSLWVMEIATRKSRKLGAPFEKGHYGYPTWSPDGNELVYTIYTFDAPGEDADIFAFSFTDEKQRLLVTQTGPQDYPALSPSGDRLAYMSSLATLSPGFGATVTQQLWTISLQTGHPEQLFYGSSRDTRPAWAPNGDSLAFSSDRGGTIEIWLAPADGSGEPSQMTNGSGTKDSPCWLANGDLGYVLAIDGQSQIGITRTNGQIEARALQPFGDGRVPLRDLSCR